MTRPTRLATHLPRGMTAYDVAVYLRVSENALAELLPQLQASGFPAPDALLKRYDKAAIDDWLDRRSGLKPASLADWERALLDRVDRDDEEAAAATDSATAGVRRRVRALRAAADGRH